MYINYRALQLPVSKLLFTRRKDTVHERGWTYGVFQWGFQGDTPGDKRKESCATEAAPVSTILMCTLIISDHPADEGRHHLFIFKELGNY